MRIHVQCLVVDDFQNGKNNRERGSNTANSIPHCFQTKKKDIIYETNGTERQSAAMGRREIAHKIWKIERQQAEKIDL